MKIVKEYVVKGFVCNSCYFAGLGSVQFSSKLSIINDLKRFIEWTVRDNDKKYFSAKILDQQSLDKFLAFTNDKNWLDNEWDIVNQDYDGYEDIFFRFTVEITFPDSKKDAKGLEQFLF